MYWSIRDKIMGRGFANIPTVLRNWNIPADLVTVRIRPQEAGAAEHKGSANRRRRSRSAQARGQLDGFIDGPVMNGDNPSTAVARVKGRPGQR
jgi:hypothetical protein